MPACRSLEWKKSLQKLIFKGCPTSNFENFVQSFKIAKADTSAMEHTYALGIRLFASFLQ